MPSHSFTRSDRISAELRRQLGGLVHQAVRDHALPSVSVSDVEVTRDFDFATVFVTALLADSSKEAVKALNEMAKEFRRELSKTMRMRRVPERASSTTIQSTAASGSISCCAARTDSSSVRVRLLLVGEREKRLHACQESLSRHQRNPPAR
jgi:ribosome-binding factor A